MARIYESVRSVAVGDRVLIPGESRAGFELHAGTVSDVLPGGRAKVNWADGSGYAIALVATLFREW